MEISRKEAMDSLKRWQQNGTTVGLHFAAHGGTAVPTMLARVAEVSSRIVVKNASSVLNFGVFKARFAYGPLEVLLSPSREGLAEIRGLHIWLESGHWLFICDVQGSEQRWLELAGLALEAKGPSGLLLAPGRPSKPRLPEVRNYLSPRRIEQIYRAALYPPAPRAWRHAPDAKRRLSKSLAISHIFVVG